MRRLAGVWIVTLMVATLWMPDDLAKAQSICVDQGAVAADNTELVSDCETLLSARDPLEGGAKLNWSAGTPIAEWEGVSLGGRPARVIRIALPDRGLSGTIPGELGNLSNLRRLYLDDNQLSGEIPGELGNLSNLEWMNLWLNQLTGTIPPELGSLSGLGYLYLSGNQLSGSIPPELGNLSKLDTLSLSANQLSGKIPARLCTFKLHRPAIL